MKSERVIEELEAYKKNPMVNLTLQDAITVIIVNSLTVDPDSEACRQKIDRIADVVQRHRLFQEDRGDTVRRINGFVNLLQVQDRQKAIELAAKSLPTDLRQTAFAWVAKIEIESGPLDDKRRNWLLDLAFTLSLEKRAAEAIIREMSPKTDIG